MVKGFEHNLFNNTAFDNGDKNDIIVMIDQGGNEGTITRNNAAALLRVMVPSLPP